MQHLCKKEKNADYKSSFNFLDDSSFSNNQALSSFKYFSEADDKSSTSEASVL